MGAVETGAVFDAAKAEYAEVAPLIWDPAGQCTVEFAKPAPGERVLDACCGAGASAIPAAEAVGPGGAVDAVDLAAGLLAQGRERAAAAGLSNIAFHEADATAWQSRGPGYDLLQCVYGVFLLEDMDAGSAKLAGLLRGGGRMAVTVWRRGALEDYARTFFDAVNAHRADSAEETTRPGVPIERIYTPDLLSSWMRESLGLSDVAVHPVERSVPLTPELAWGLVLGSGLRGALVQFGQDAPDGGGGAKVAAVKADFLALLADREIATLDTSSLVGVGTAP